MVDVIFDANSLFARSYFAAVASPELQGCLTRKGRPAGATVAALKTVFCLLNPTSRLCLPDKADRLLFCWDSPNAKSEKDRKEKPADYHEQLGALHRTLYRLFGAAHCEVDGEADDAVATAAYRSEEEGNTVYVVSGDKDLQQLLGGKINIYSLNTKTLVRRQDILSRWKVKRPIQLALYLALAGDASDKIAGIRGYGPKTVAKLFEAVTPRMKFSEALEALRAQIPAKYHAEFERCLDMTLLRTDVEGVPDPAPLQWADADYVLGRTDLESVCGEYLSVYGHYTGRHMEVEDFVEC